MRQRNINFVLLILAIVSAPVFKVKADRVGDSARSFASSTGYLADGEIVKRSRRTGKFLGGACPADSKVTEVLKQNNTSIEKIAKVIFGEKADCYLKVFDNETGGNPTCYQPAGLGNRFSAYGICSLWSDPARLRAGVKGVDTLAHRSSHYSMKGAGHEYACSENMDGGSIDGIIAQMQCCAFFAEYDPAYFNKGVECSSSSRQHLAHNTARKH